jgi:hypothetical protein
MGNMTALLLLALMLVAWLVYEARPLTEIEASGVARRRRLAAIMRSYGFRRGELLADRQAKGEVRGSGLEFAHLKAQVGYFIHTPNIQYLQLGDQHP